MKVIRSVANATPYGFFDLPFTRRDDHRLSAALLLAGLLNVSPSFAQIQFNDATPGSGITHVGESYGASVGDLNADGWPDLFVNQHRERPALLVNMGDGTFVDRTLEVDSWTALPFLDQHGGAWGDFNNDGFEDLFIGLGATDDVQFLVNDNGVLFDRTLEYGLDAYRSWPGRLPIWLDYDADGALDFSMMLRGNPKIFRQDVSAATADTWVDTKSQVIMQCQNAQYGQLLDLNADGSLDLICDNQTLWPNRVYDTTTIPFTDITAMLPAQQAVNDTAIGDFDNNLRNDIFQVRGGLRLSEAVQVDADSIEAQLIVDNGSEEYLRFSTTGIVSFLLDWNRRNKDFIFIGAGGYNPDNFGPDDPIQFDLDPQDPSNWGIKPHDPALEDGIWIGYDDASGYWEVQLSAGLLININYWFIDSQNPITDMTTGGFSAGEAPLEAKLLMNYPAGVLEEAASRGMADPIQCVSTVAGDFDNDMDQDVYAVCRGGVSNIANILYENNGDGTFQVVPGAGGAAGPVGIGVGVGENVVTADFDADGFLDLYVTNGLNIYPEAPLFESRGGPDKLYRNAGNANNWVELDLVGTTANRTAIGAKVYATAGGLTQLREQNGGYHRWSQNHQRIHFGLAGNATVDITVEWPGGATETYTDVPANSLYRVTEGSGYEEVVLGQVEPSECGAPDIDTTTVADLFVYRDCAADQWHIITTAGGDYSRYTGRIISDQPLLNVNPLDIEGHDEFDTTAANAIEFSLQVWNTGRDEFSFSVAPGARACLQLEAPADVSSVKLGSVQVAIGLPVDLGNLGPCEILPAEISIADVTIDEVAGTVSLTATLAEASTQTVSADWITVDGSATAPADYQSASGTLSFAPGEVLQTIDVLINDDTEGELSETFMVELSAPVNATLLESSATVTISDDEESACGEPEVDSATETGVFVWQDCQTGVWHLRMTAGPTYALFMGTLSAGEPFSSVLPLDIEGHDMFDTANPQVIDFALQAWAGGVDEFTFTLAPGVPVCLDSAAALQVQVGEDRTPFAMPFDPATLSACTNLAVEASIVDIEVGETLAEAEFTVSLDAASAQTVTLDWATIDGTATAPADYVAGAGQVTFLPGELEQTLTVQLVDDSLGEATEEFSVQLSNPVNAVLLQDTAVARIVDNEESACGEPAVDGSVDASLFVWQDCQTGVWHLRATAGGGYASYTGGLASPAALAGPTAIDIEPHDALNTPSTGEIEFLMQIWGNGLDEFSFQPVPGQPVCLTLEAGGAQTALVGDDRQAYSLPLDLNTLGPCTNLPAEISIDDVSVDEAAGVATFNVSLAAASQQTVSVDWATVSGTATAPADYAAANGSLSFAPGQLTLPVVVTVNEDNLGEGDEQFAVELSNPIEGLIAVGSGTATIVDNEISPCGRPVIDGASDAAVFVWQDCTTAVWHVAATAGGAYANWQGAVTSSQTLASVTPVDIEGHDTLDTSTATTAAFSLQIWGNGADEFTVSTAPGATACISISSPSGTTVLYGPDRQPAPAAFELKTLAACPF